MNKKEPRKATEVLAEIDNKTDQILGYMKNLDLLIKNLNNRVKNLEQNLGKPQEKPLPSSPESAVKKLPGLKAGVKIGNYEGAPSVSLPEETSEGDFEEPIEVETVHKGVRRNTRGMTPDKSIMVKQKVVFSDGKPLCLAKVEIYDDATSDFITSVKTNALGEWAESLTANKKYNIQISKRATGRKPGVEDSYQIFVENSDVPKKLDPHKIS